MPMSKNRSSSFGTGVHHSAASKQDKFEARAVVRHVSFDQTGFKSPLDEPTTESMDFYEPVNPDGSYEEDEEGNGTYEPVRPYEEDNEYEEEPREQVSTGKSNVAVRRSILGVPTPFLGQPTPFLKKLTPALGKPIPVVERPTSPKSPLSSSPPPPLPPRNTGGTSHRPLPPTPPEPALLPPLPPKENLLELREEDENCDTEYMPMDDGTQFEEYIVPQTDITLERTPSPSDPLPEGNTTYEMVDTKRPVPPARRNSRIMFGHLALSSANQSSVVSSSYVMLQKAAT